MNFSGVIGEGVAAPITAVGNALDSLFTSDEERAKALFVMERLKQKPHVLQAEINKIDAKSKNWFQSGWRPAIGWLCVAGLAITFVINPCLQWATGITGPELPIGTLHDLVIALLGLGGLRTFEKVKGIKK